MRRLALLLLCIPVTGLAVAVRTFPSAPLRIGDRIVLIEIDLGTVPLQTYPTPRFAVTNLDVVSSEWETAAAAAAASSTLLVRGIPAAVGEIVLGPFEYNSASGPVRVPAVRVPVAPDLADGSHAAASLAALAKADRSEAVVVTMLRRARIYAGEEAVVEWWAVGDLQNLSVNAPPTNPIAIAGIDRTQIDTDSRRALDAVGGRIVTRQLLAHLHLFPTRPGVYTIPSIQVTGSDLRRKREIGTSVHRLDFIRSSPPAQLEVVPPPAGVVGVLGRYHFECTSPFVDRYWPVVHATVSGGGELKDAPLPEFSADGPETVIIRSTVPDFYNHALRRVFVYEVHAEKAQLPPLQWSYYDTAENREVTLRCEPPPLMLRTTPRPKQPETQNPFAGHVDVATVVESSGVGALCLALAVLVRALRD